MDRWRLSLLLRVLPATVLMTTVAASGWGLELRPWYGSAFEGEWRPALAYSTYNEVDSVAGTVSHSSDDLFAAVGVGGALFQRWHAQAELLLARTSTQELAVAHLAATGRYLILDDIIGDPISLVAGVTVLAPFADPDISLRYHGNVGVEGHFSAGRECSCEATWLWRWWTFAAIGIADEGDPWVRGKVSVEKNFCDTHQFQLYTEALFGLGDRDLNMMVPFSGYENLGHQSVDVGVAYTWCVAFYWDVTAGYQYRVYAKNTALGVHTATVSLRYPFSL